MINIFGVLLSCCLDWPASELPPIAQQLLQLLRHLRRMFHRTERVFQVYMTSFLGSELEKEPKGFIGLWSRDNPDNILVLCVLAHSNNSNTFKGTVRPKLKFQSLFSHMLMGEVSVHKTFYGASQQTTLQRPPKQLKQLGTCFISWKQQPKKHEMAP